MSTTTLQHEKITVIGMGKSGTAAAVWLARQGADVLVVDDRSQAIPDALREGGIRFHLGEWTEGDLFGSDRIVISPGFPVSRLPMAKLRSAGIPVVGEMEMAAAQISAPILAVTGTNGKSTTTTLIGDILNAWGMSVFVGGNLGRPLSEAIDGTWDFVVVEASSFQLETIDRFHPRVAVLLNVTPDHLDRYPDFKAYRLAKWRIFKNQTPKDYAILNMDEQIPPTISAATAFFSRTVAPARGVFVRDGQIMTRLRDGEAEPIFKTDEMKIHGAHNVENVLAAVAATEVCGAPLSAIRQALSTFTGLPHRMELVREINHVRYIDDSKGTNVGAVAKSLEGMMSPVILIAGGQAKGCDFAPLREIVLRKTKRLILLGEAQAEMARCFADHPAVDRVASMEAAVATAHAHAAAGDIVLLSPACASFDLFRDYRHRGEVFKQAVDRL